MITTTCLPACTWLIHFLFLSRLFVARAGTFVERVAELTGRGKERSFWFCLLVRYYCGEFGLSCFEYSILGGPSMKPVK